MDELTKAREQRDAKAREQQAQRLPDLQLQLWVHADGYTTRQIMGNANKFPIGSTKDMAAIVDKLLEGVQDVALDFSDDEDYDDSWKMQPVTLVYFNRGGARYSVPHAIYSDECVSWRGRLGLAWFMLRRTWLMVTWGLRLVRLSFTYKPPAEPRAKPGPDYR